MTNKSINKLDDTTEVKKRGRKKVEPTVKGLGLFDHVKHIRSVKDPEYFNNLTELDRKSFSHFMILRVLSMNPELLDDISTLFRYFDKIPSPQFYKLLIAMVPLDKRYHPWVKGKKKLFSLELIELIAKFFEVSKKEAEEYASVLSLTEKGNKELLEIVRAFGHTDKEVEYILKIKEDE